jgi:hypothetical protein
MKEQSRKRINRFDWQAYWAGEMKKPRLDTYSASGVRVMDDSLGRRRRRREVFCLVAL